MQCIRNLFELKIFYLTFLLHEIFSNYGRQQNSMIVMDTIYWQVWVSISISIDMSFLLLLLLVIDF